MEERLTIEISATPQRVFDAVKYEATQIERVERDTKRLNLRRLPEGDVGKGTVIELSAENSSVSLTVKFVEYTPPNYIRVDWWGMGANSSTEYAITDLGTQCRLDFISKPLHKTAFMKFANWLNQKILKKHPTLQSIKDLAESDKDLRV